MSKQGKTPPLPPPSTHAVPGAVAQQAQQYLEQNVMAWMQPHGQQMISSALSSLAGPCPAANQRLLHESMTQTSPRHMMSPAASGGQYPAMGRPGGQAPSVSGTSCMGNPPSSCIPHSLSFSGYSHHSLMQGTSFSSPCPSIYGTAQPSAAANFFARAAQKLNLSSRRRRRLHHQAGEGEPPPFRTNFCDILRASAPPVPPSLLRSVGRKESFVIGKVKVMLRIAPSSSATCESSSFLNTDARKKQVTVYDPGAGSSATTSDRRTTGISAPKMFAFDAVFSPDDTQTEVCSSSLPEVIQAVVGGTDGCLFVYGQSKLGKTHTMVGSSDSIQGLGAIPCAISWLFRLIHEQRQKTGARFSVRVSALEISGRNEVLTDLLSEYAAGTEGSGTSPGVYLKDDPVFGTQLINQSELRAPTPEKAGYLLDAALAARNIDGEDEGKNSHFLFTLHVYQYRVERNCKGGVAGGRSRLHLFDLGSCDKGMPKSRDVNPGGCLSLSALGNVILALFNGQKHVPYKESKLTQVLREATHSLTCRVAMIAHVSSSAALYSEILGTIQLASRIHRMRRKKIKVPNIANMEATYDEKGVCVRPFLRMHAEDSTKTGNSDPDYTSSSEQSCDTVIYVGTGGLPLNDRDFSDNEAPPSSLPVLPKTSSKTPPKPENADLRGTSASLTATTNHDQAKASSPSKGKNSSKEDRFHQPASTQTIRPESTQKGSPNPTPKKKHRSAQQKQDGGGGGGGGGASNKVQQPSSPTPKTLPKEKLQSDEMWIDGPRFSKPKFDTKTLHRLQKEQWVDGPPVIYGFMDDHKQSMIRQWVEEHSSSLSKDSASGAKKKSEVWVDFPRGSADGETKKSASGSIDQKLKENSQKKDHPKNHAEPEYAVPYRPNNKTPDSVDNNQNQEMTACDNQSDTEQPDYDLDSASNSADVDETDNEENVEIGGYDSELYPLPLDTNEVETIEVMEPEEPVPMVDSCLQVTEEDIIAECWLQNMRQNIAFRHQFEGKEHPLRILSEEELNLPSSFSDSRSVSIDLDSISVPDTYGDIHKGKAGLTWRLLYGNMFQKIKEQQLLQRKAGENISSNRASIASESLERISKLREMIQPMSQHAEQINRQNIKFTSFRTKPYVWPLDTSCNALSEMVCNSNDSSVEDLSAAELTSTHSEPADLDAEKYDFKFNVKPMNGLKLEAFYNKIHKVPPFSENYIKMKPAQSDWPLVTDEENRQLLSQLDNQRIEGLVKERSNSFSHRPPMRNYRQNINDSMCPNDQSVFQRKFSFSSLSRLEAASIPRMLKEQKANISSERLLTSSDRDLNTEVRSTDSDKSVSRTAKGHKTKTPSNDLNDASKRSESKNKSGGLTYKNIDTSQLTVGASPTKSKSSRGKSSSKDLHSLSRDQTLCRPSNSSIRTKDSSISSSSSSGVPPRCAIPLNSNVRQSSTKNVNNCCSNGICKASKTIPNGKPSTRTSPTSNGSSTSGVTTTCCATMKQKPTPTKSKLADHSKQKQSGGRSDKKQRNKSICRSTSSPSTCVDSGETAMTDITDSEHYYVTRHASVSSSLPSPYHKVPQTLVIPHSRHHRRHQRTSSGNGSDSSMNSLEPREAKDLLKGTKTQQFSGTSSGYESMMRDSEGTPISSSQESGTEGSVGKGERGRKGRRKSEGSSKRSLSAPARSPPSPNGPRQIAVDQQPGADSNLLRRGDRSLRRSDEEVCCPSFLCCRLLDFY